MKGAKGGQLVKESKGTSPLRGRHGRSRRRSRGTWSGLPGCARRCTQLPMEEGVSAVYAAVQVNIIPH